MKTKSILIFCSLIVLVFFQNCNQAGGLNLAEPELQKSSATEPGPLVVDVVDAIDEIKNTNNNNTTDSNSGSDGSDVSADPVADSGGDSSAGGGDSVSEEPPSTIADNGTSSAPEVAQPQPESQPEVVSQPEPEVINNVEEVLADNSCGKNGEKVLVCHFPPGNASAKHTICISRRALEAHLSHGHKDEQHQDHVGACVQ